MCETCDVAQAFFNASQTATRNPQLASEVPAMATAEISARFPKYTYSQKPYYPRIWGEIPRNNGLEHRRDPEIESALIEISSRLFKVDISSAAPLPQAQPSLLKRALGFR